MRIFLYAIVTASGVFIVAGGVAARVSCFNITTGYCAIITSHAFPRTWTQGTCYAVTIIIVGTPIRALIWNNGLGTYYLFSVAGITVRSVVWAFGWTFRNTQVICNGASTGRL